MENHNDRIWWDEASYQDPKLAIYRGNPFIEALPPILSRSISAATLVYAPDFNVEDRELPVELRLHLIQNVREFFQAFGVHLDLEERFSSMIRRGYRSRNPMEKGYWININKKIKLLESDRLVFNSPQSSATGFAIIGVPGMGKTTAINKILGLYPQVIQHIEYGEKTLNAIQIVWLKLECPFDGSIKGLCLAFFDSVDNLLGTDYYDKYVGNDPNRVSVDKMLRSMARVALLHSIGVLVIDEIQHLKEAHAGGSSKMLNFFVQLVNMIGLPVVLVGTYKATRVLTKEFRQARRGTGEGDLVWDRMVEDEEWELFTRGLWDHVYVQEPSDWTHKLSQVLYDESQGIIDIAVKMFIRAQHRAITTGAEKLTESIIRSTARDDFRLIHKVLSAFRQGLTTDLEKFEDVYTAFLKHFAKLPRRPNHSDDSPIDSDTSVDEANPDENKPPPLVVYPANKPPQRKSGRKLGTGTKNEHQLFMLKGGLVETVSEGKKQSLSPYEALRQAGFIRSVTEFLDDDGLEPLGIAT